MRVQLILATVAICVTACSTTPKIADTYGAYIKNQGFSPLYPPRENFGAGVVYQIVESEGVSYPNILCPTLFSDVQPSESKTTLETMTYAGSANFGLALNVLSGLITSVKSAEANLQAAKTELISIALQDTTIEDLRFQFSESGTEVVVSPQCIARLKALKDKGELKSVRVNERALLVQKLAVQVDRKPSGTASANIDVKSLINIKPELKTEAKSTNSLEVISPMYAGVNARAITDVLPTFKVGAETWVIKGLPVKLPSNFRSQQ